ncbi:hypothetical protein O3G_MSEX010747 [Manduca sexta]|uniref:lysozyme n=1 Tax=Manduca sexta TaxID=7130 RepID=A0A921ZI50_MANSE|nr:hypothetical protein O3G_MSEX010747 [Manduca sexta]
MNISRRELVIPVCMVAVFVLWISGSTGTTFIPNLTERCYRCLCYVSTKCDRSYGCAGGYCGPFNISRVYWVDAGKVVMKEDDPERNHEILILYCDCNGDGVTNCFDYMMVNGNGGYGCTTPLNNSENGRRWLQRYSECQL